MKLLLLCLFLLNFPQTTLAATIDSVHLEIIDQTGQTSPKLLQRMQNSMQLVAEQMLVSKDTEKVAVVHNDYNRLLKEVGERALTGYLVEDVAMVLGNNTVITLQVTPWLSTVGKVDVDLRFSGVSPLAEQILLNKIPNMTINLKSIVAGASIDAVEWMGGLVRQSVRMELERELPDFKASVDLNTQPDGTVLVQVIVYPVGQIVQDVEFELFSDSVPNILFMNTKERMHRAAESLRGLPLAFLERNKAQFQSVLLDQVRAEKVTDDYDLIPEITIVPGVVTNVSIYMRANKYKIWLEGYADVGKDEDNLSGKAHFGKYISDNIEAFGEIILKAKNMEWDFAGGVAYHKSKTTVSYIKGLKDDERAYRLEYALSPKWQLRAEHYANLNANEFAVRYRLHEFLSFEYVYSNKEPYLRIIGNL